MRLKIASILALLLAPLFWGWNLACAQPNTFAARLSLLPHVTLTELPNSNFAGYYVLNVQQPLDHAHPKGTFSQRILLGIQDPQAPVLLVTEGYGADYATQPTYQHELAKMLNMNQLVVEHRYFGKSRPETMDYQWLTTVQAAADIHAIHNLLDTLLTGKWISTGTSKGGQAALAHRIHYPKDVVASVVYGTAVKKTAFVHTQALLKPLMQNPSGKRVAAFQQYCFQEKGSLLPLFRTYAESRKLDFGTMPLEVVLEYALLEYPFSFWQSGADCESIPQAGQSLQLFLDGLVSVVPPQYYTTMTRGRLEPAFYMFYHELGYYEYDLPDFHRSLKLSDYPNRFFAPPLLPQEFDNTYLAQVRSFLGSAEARTVFFIYGENDPWALQSIVRDNKYVIVGGSHKSKIADLSSSVRAGLLNRLIACLGP